MSDRGRRFEPVLGATLESLEGGRCQLRAPAVGLWRGAPADGLVVTPGSEIGELEILGVLHQLVAPAGARGVVVETGGDESRARRPVGYGDVLIVLDASADLGAAFAATAAAEEEGGAEAALVFRASTSGRFYDRPAPDKPPFVSVGDLVSRGQTVCLLEVMKTFNRVQYGGDDLPERARVVAIRPAGGDDLDAGDVILELEPAD